MLREPSQARKAAARKVAGSNGGGGGGDDDGDDDDGDGNGAGDGARAAEPARGTKASRQPAEANVLGSSGYSEVDAAAEAEVAVPKRRRKTEAPAAAEAAAAVQPRKMRGAIGGDCLVGPSGDRAVESEAVALQRQLSQKEAAWRAKHGGEGPVPEQAKNRDVVWRALERKLQRSQLDQELAGLT